MLVLLTINKGYGVPTFGDKIKNARKEKKLSQDMLSKLIGVSRVAITNYETNKNTPTYDNIKKLSNALGIHLSSDEKPVKFVPVVGTASCGNCESNILQDFTMKTAISEEDWNSELYAVVANGDSMATEIYDGDIAIIDPKQTPQNGDMVFYKIDDEAAIKIYVKDEDAYLLSFIPFNTNDCFKTKNIRLDDSDMMEKLTVHKVSQVVSIKKNNRTARLKMIGR